MFISLDTLRGDFLGPNKYRFLPSDFRDSIKSKFGHDSYLDSLVSKGLCFSNCFSAAPFTTASHASIFTGYMPLHHGVYEYFNSDIKRKTIFQYAKQHEFKTIFQTDFPVILGEPIGFKRGVDEYYVEAESDALDALDYNVAQNEKTLSFFHFGAIHYPYGFHSLKFSGDDYRNKVRELEKEFLIEGNILPRDQFDESFRNDDDKEFLFRYKKIVEHLYDTENYSRLTELYLEGIQYFLEHRFKMFMEKLQKILPGEDSLIILFGDHGEEWSSDSKGHYKSLSLGVLNVPLVFIGPGILPATSDALVRTIDITPTALDAMGIGIPDDIDGDILDIKTPSTIPRNNASIAQVWLGVGKQELISHIDKAHKEGAVKEKMKTVMTGESIIKGNIQFLRMFHKNGDLYKEEIRSLVDNVVVSEDLEGDLRLILKKYNQSKIDIDRIDGVEDSIKEQFKLLGYNV